jgi:hypothetical protein
MPNHPHAPARSRRKGRPTKFVPALRKRLVEIISIGTPLRFACAACRISYASFCEYRIAHPDFDNEIEAARAASIEKHLRNIIAAAEAGSTADSRWYLERCFPAEFGRTKLEVTGADGEPLAGAQIAVLVWPHQQNQNHQNEITEKNHPAAVASDPG